MDGNQILLLDLGIEGSSDKSHPWLYQSALLRKRGLRLATKSIACSDRFCRHIPVPGEGLNFSDLPEAPWKLVDQRFDTDKQPYELHLEIKTERGPSMPVLSAAGNALHTTSRRKPGGT